MKVRHQTERKGTAVLLFVLSALLLVCSLSICVSAYLAGSDLISDATVRVGLSAYFEKSARSITKEDLEQIRAVKLTDTSVSFGASEIVTGLKKNHALSVTDTESILDLDSYYHTVSLTVPLSDFTWLSCLPKIEYLSVAGRAVEEIESFAGFENLYALEIAGDQSESFDLTELLDLPNLQVLTASDCAISDVSPLSEKEALIRLGLSGNEIADLSPLASLSALRVLALENNEVADVTALQNLTSLEYLDLSGNRVSDVSALSGLTELRQLSLSNESDEIEGNAVSDLSVLTGFEQLEFFYANYNPIESLAPLASLRRLCAVSLDGCGLESVEGLETVKKLSYLSLKNNRLTDVSPLCEAEKLSYLFLEGNEKLKVTDALKELSERVQIDVLAKTEKE
ncbi:MAG: leucine-rich repeat domain-containing protein [Clostridia bacterium]|nr:leucine-rich repeat domain-containing protein [Clostridia bacterium]